MHTDKMVVDIHNMLFDEETNRITALLDFDFAYVASRVDEYFYSLGYVAGIVWPVVEEDPDGTRLRNNIISGFEDGAEDLSSKRISWKVAVMLDRALLAASVERPQDIPGIDQLSTVYWLIQSINPYQFDNKEWKESQSPEKLEESRSGTQRDLEKYLKRLGL